MGLEWSGGAVKVKPDLLLLLLLLSSSIFYISHSSYDYLLAIRERSAAFADEDLHSHMVPAPAGTPEDFCMS